MLVERNQLLIASRCPDQGRVLIKGVCCTHARPRGAAEMSTAVPGRAAAISDAVSRMFRITARAKHELAQRDPAMKDFAVMVVLANLVERGPQRSASLASCLHLDPSQVSRHVATAVRAGLVERRIDPVDGRAIQLVPTLAGQRRYLEFAAARAAHLEEVVADWDTTDIEIFARYLDRFVNAFERHTVRMFEASEAIAPRASALPELDPVS
jgi:DNA-binding MarR family transcriptional regulator